MEPDRDLYAILQVSEDAEPEVIRAAYRTLARKYHPDRNSDPEAPERLEQINDAYEVLRTPEKRREYDASRDPGRDLVPVEGPAERGRRRGRGRPRAERRRQSRHEAAGVRPILRRTDTLVVAALAVVVFVVAGAAIASSALGDGDDSSSDVESSIPVGSTAPVFSPGTADGQAVVVLARRSVEALPQGQWPALYDSFTAEFQQRCLRSDFEQAGVEDAENLGDSLTGLRFKWLEGVTLEESSAGGVIVGELVGVSEYRIQAAFQKEAGTWKIAPVTGTSGCSAFNRLSG